MPRVLMIVTSHEQLDAGHKTGLWLEEYAIPLRAFRDAGFEVVTASPHGGQAPIDPRSLEGASPDPDAVAALRDTKTIGEAGDASDYDAVFLPGGHGTMFDLATNEPVKTLLAEFDAQHKIVAAVCHGPAAFVGAISAMDPTRLLVQGRRITAFTDNEERAVHLDKAVPFLLASKLREQGATVVEGADWADHVEVDGTWVTGQNPQSSASTAKAVIELLKTRV